MSNLPSQKRSHSEISTAEATVTEDTIDLILNSGQKFALIERRVKTEDEFRDLCTALDIAPGVRLDLNNDKTNRVLNAFRHWRSQQTRTTFDFARAVGSFSRALADELGLCQTSIVSTNVSAIAVGTNAVSMMDSAASALATLSVGALQFFFERLEAACEQDSLRQSVVGFATAILRLTGLDRVNKCQELLMFLRDKPELLHVLQLSSREFAIHDAVFKANSSTTIDSQTSTTCYYLSDFMPVERWIVVVDEIRERMRHESSLRVVVVIGCHSQATLNDAQKATIDDLFSFANNAVVRYLQTKENDLAAPLDAKPVTFVEQLSASSQDDSLDVHVCNLLKTAAEKLPKCVSQSHRRLISLIRLCVHGLGPFGKPPDGGDDYEFPLNGSGVCLVTADMFGMFSNGFGKSTLSITTLMWCLTGLSEPRGVNGKKNAVTGDLINDACEEARVKLVIDCDLDGIKNRFTITRRLTRKDRKISLVVERRGAANVYDLEAQRCINVDVFDLPLVEASSMGHNLRDYLLRTMFLTPGSMESLTHDETRNSMLYNMNDDPRMALKHVEIVLKDCQKEFKTKQNTHNIALAAEEQAKKDVARVDQIDVTVMHNEINQIVSEITPFCGIDHGVVDACDFHDRLVLARQKRDDCQASFEKSKRELANATSATRIVFDGDADQLQLEINAKSVDMSTLTKQLSNLQSTSSREKNCIKCLAPINRENIETQRKEWNDQVVSLKVEIKQLQGRKNHLLFVRVGKSTNVQIKR